MFLNMDEGVCMTICAICGDRATGKHFGAISCHSCKGFFRRTIRLGYKYKCRFVENCKVDKNRRTDCRACRYNRCIKAGMKAEAVQMERDSIGKRQRVSSSSGATSNSKTSQESMEFTPSPESLIGIIDDDWESPKALIDALLRSEEKMKSLKDVVITKTGKLWTAMNVKGGDEANLDDIYHSIHTQLILVIEWAKTIQSFVQLPTDDQVILLKNFAPQHIVLCLAYRSKDSPDYLKLINDKIIYLTNDENDSEYFYKKDCQQIMDQLVKPMRYMQIDETEFATMKACVLFNPVLKGLSIASESKVLESRRKIFSALENYVKNKMTYDANRIGDLTFFILSSLQSLAKSISEDVYMTKLTGVVHLDMLMEELMLDDTNSDENLVDLGNSLGEENF